MTISAVIIDNLINTAQNEAYVEDNFIWPLCTELGYKEEEIKRQFHIQAIPGKTVDFAIQKRTGRVKDFLVTDPSILIEVKNNSVDLDTLDQKEYIKTVDQLKFYMLNIPSVQWGIISNGKTIQVFEKHEKVIIPVTQIITIRIENLPDIIKLIKKLFGNKKKHPLIISVFNNKGGTGKTTTVANLGVSFMRQNKKVLLVDLDPQQRDLTRLFCYTKNIEDDDRLTSIYEILMERTPKAQPGFIHRKYFTKNKNEISLALIPADSKFDNPEFYKKKNIGKIATAFRKFLKTRYEFDYILIDCPTNWSFFSKTGVLSSDVLLIPMSTGSLSSIHNGFKVMDTFLTEAQDERKDGGPNLLFSFFNAVHDSEANIDQREAEKEFEKLRENNSVINNILYPNKKGVKSDFLPIIKYFKAIQRTEFQTPETVNSEKKLPVAGHQNDVYNEYLYLIDRYFVEIPNYKRKS